jgi:DNA-binding response OmpR family regulator
MLPQARVCFVFSSSMTSRRSFAFLRASLQGQGYIVSTAANARTALDMVRKKAADLVVLDLGLLGWPRCRQSNQERRRNLAHHHLVKP